MTAKTMAEVVEALARHNFEREQGEGEWTHCPESVHPGWIREAQRTVDFLTAAGFGLVADAWDEGRESFALSLLRPLRDDLTRESIPNPYRKETDRV